MFWVWVSTGIVTVLGAAFLALCFYVTIRSNRGEAHHQRWPGEPDMDASGHYCPRCLEGHPNRDCR